VRFGRRHIQPQRRVIQRARTDPSDALLNRVARQEARDAWESDPPLHRMPRGHRVRSAAHRRPNWTPLRQARNQWRVFSSTVGFALVKCRSTQFSRYLSMRIAVALNSDVPDLGSTASIVKSFVATCS